MRAARDIAWSCNLVCTPERNLPASAASFAVAALSFCRFQVAAIISFSRFEMSVWLPAAAATTAATAHLLRLRELALEWVCLDKGHVGARFRMTVLRRGVEADQIAGNQLEILQAQRGGAAHFFAPGCCSKSIVFSGPPLTE